MFARSPFSSQWLTPRCLTERAAMSLSRLFGKHDVHGACSGSEKKGGRLCSSKSSNSRQNCFSRLSQQLFDVAGATQPLGLGSGVAAPSGGLGARVHRHVAFLSGRPGEGGLVEPDLDAGIGGDAAGDEG